MSIQKNKMYILPCLQERRSNPGKSGWLNYEQEQRGSVIHYGKQKNCKYTKMLREENIDEYYKRWKAAPAAAAQEVPIEDQADSRKSLEYVHLDKRCKDIETKDKWILYIKHLIAKGDINHVTGILVTHHHRLTGKFKFNFFSKEKGLLPFNTAAEVNTSKELKGGCPKYLWSPRSPNTDEPPIDSYANCFCLKITLTKSAAESAAAGEAAAEAVPTYEETHDGNKIKKIVKISKGTQKFVLTFEILSKGFSDKAEYNYCDVQHIKWINTTGIEEAFKSTITDSALPEITIYLVRHGNSLHNKPLKKNPMTKLDSSLSLLGIFQAETVGKLINKDIQRATKVRATAATAEAEAGTGATPQLVVPKILLCCSFLSRSQLTGLTILEQINDVLKSNENTELKHDHNLLKMFAIKRHLLSELQSKSKEIINENSSLDEDDLENHLESIHICIDQSRDPDPILESLTKKVVPLFFSYNSPNIQRYEITHSDNLSGNKIKLRDFEIWTPIRIVRGPYPEPRLQRRQLIGGEYNLFDIIGIKYSDYKQQEIIKKCETVITAFKYDYLTVSPTPVELFKERCGKYFEMFDPVAAAKAAVAALEALWRDYASWSKQAAVAPLIAARRLDYASRSKQAKESALYFDYMSLMGGLSTKFKKQNNKRSTKFKKQNNKRSTKSKKQNNKRLTKSKKHSKDF
jgi:hypothetical protein